MHIQFKFDEEEIARYKKFMDSDKVQWHEPWRHGVIRNIPRKESNRFNRMIEYYMGSKACFWTRGARSDLMDVEFVHMAKVYPPPKKPWEWCGTSILFPDWQKDTVANQNAREKFNIGDKVRFTAKGRTIEGIVYGGRKRVAIVAGREKWYVPPTQLELING